MILTVGFVEFMGASREVLKGRLVTIGQIKHKVERQ